MRRFNLSLFSLFAIVTCVILLVVSLYERRRANEIESKSIAISSPEYRAIIEQDWQIIKRELQLEFALRQFERDHGDSIADIEGVEILPIGGRREAANIRNSQLKLDREKMKLDGMKKDLIKTIVQSSIIPTTN